MPLYTLPKELHPDFAVPGRKPIGPVKVDWDNPLTLGLTNAIVNGLDHVRQFPSSLPAGATFDANTYRCTTDHALVADESPGIDNVTAMFRATPRTSLVNDNMYFGNGYYVNGTDNRGWGFRSANGGAGVELYTGNDDYSGTRWSLTGGVFEVDVTKTYAAYFTANGANRKLWIDGILQTPSGSGGTNGLGATTTSLGFAGNDGVGYWSSKTEITADFDFGFVWNRQLSDAEVRAISADPYQIFKPAVPLTYFTPAAAATTQFPIILPKQFHPDFAVPGHKPTGPVEIDWGNYFASKLKHAWLFQNGSVRDLVGDKHGTISGSTIFPKSGDMYFENDGSTDRIDLGTVTASDFLSFSTGQATVVSKVYYLGDDATPHPFPRIIDKSNSGAAQNGWALYRDAGAGTWQYLQDRDGASFAQAFVTEAGNDGWYNIAGGVDEANDEIFCQVNRTRATTSPGAFTVEHDVDTSCAIGNWNHTTDREWQGLISHIFVFEGYLTESEVNAINADPYQILKPAIPMTYFTAAAAGGGAYPMPLHHHYQVNIGSQ